MDSVGECLCINKYRWMCNDYVHKHMYLTAGLRPKAFSASAEVP
jgi:hypothetical protein